MKSMKLRQLSLSFIVCACQLLALTLCRGDLEAVESSDEAELTLIEAPAAQIEAIEDEEGKLYQDANAASREAAVLMYLKEEAKGPSNSPRKANGANQEAVRTVEELMRDNPLAIARCVTTLRQLWRFQYLLFHVNACASGHCLAFAIVVWFLMLFKRGQRQQLEKLTRFYIPAVFCLFLGAFNRDKGWSILASTQGYDDLPAIIAEARLVVSDASVIPDPYRYFYFLLTLVTLLPLYFSVIIVCSLILPLPRFPMTNYQL